jgi:adenylate kinase
MDGFPRTLEQVKTFKNGVDKVIYLNISDKEALIRLEFQNSDGSRPDASTEAIKKRIEVFHGATEPVIHYYKEKGMLIEINGERPIEEISKEIFSHLK